MRTRRPHPWLWIVALLLVPAAARAWTVVPIPEIITDPNEGNTYGILPVVLFTDDTDRIAYMLAPDFTYNDTKGFYPRFRFFGYPTNERRYKLVVGKSTTKDQIYDGEYSDRSLWDGRAFVFAELSHELDSTERFYGFGNGSYESGESNYTSNNTLAIVDPGVWVLPHVSLAYRMRVRRFEVERGQVRAFPFVGAAHPETAARGLETGVYWAHQLTAAYDTRDDTDMPTQGMLAAAYGEAADHALGSATSFVKFGAEWRDFVPVRIRKLRAVLALRALIDYVSGSRDTPFWEMSSLGGRRALRGFGGDRFIDFNRALAGGELRTPVYGRKVLGVNAELEVAPYFETGQVFHGVGASPVNDLHVAYGMGFRLRVRPQVVAFVDLGYGYEGMSTYTGVSYPF
ncbi:MAG: BamA/TamA family outer membrane protein [Candidatus Binatia bacterium]